MCGGKQAPAPEPPKVKPVSRPEQPQETAQTVRPGMVAGMPGQTTGSALGDAGKVTILGGTKKVGA